MARAGPRIHRLPQRLDYTLIPAPLDLSLPLVTEKSPLPAIIVTPSSPSSSRDFSIAFLAPPQKPTIRERLSTYTTPFSLKARTVLITFLVIFVLVCHVATHRLASRRPHLAFAVQGDAPHLVETPFAKWFNFRSLWEDSSTSNVSGDFVIDEPLGINS